jgi:hypothetical protein
MFEQTYPMIPPPDRWLALLSTAIRHRRQGIGAVALAGQDNATGASGRSNPIALSFNFDVELLK